MDCRGTFYLLVRNIEEMIHTTVYFLVNIRSAVFPRFKMFLKILQLKSEKTLKMHLVFLIRFDGVD